MEHTKHLNNQYVILMHQKLKKYYADFAQPGCIIGETQGLLLS
jgi:hypothetical protein